MRRVIWLAAAVAAVGMSAAGCGGASGGSAAAVRTDAASVVSTVPAAFNAAEVIAAGKASSWTSLTSEQKLLVASRFVAVSGVSTSPKAVALAAERLAAAGKPTGLMRDFLARVTAGAAPTPTPPAPVPSDPVVSGDTGRMSQGEWDQAKTSIFDVNHELQDYGNKVGQRCAVILTGGEVKNALDCFGEAYDGVEGSLALAQDDLRGLQGDTGGQCRKALGIAAAIADGALYRAGKGSKEALDSLDTSAITVALRALRRQKALWDHASGNALQLCAPQ